MLQATFAHCSRRADQLPSAREIQLNLKDDFTMTNEDEFQEILQLRGMNKKEVNEGKKIAVSTGSHMRIAYADRI